MEELATAALCVLGRVGVRFSIQSDLVLSTYSRLSRNNSLLKKPRSRPKASATVILALLRNGMQIIFRVGLQQPIKRRLLTINQTSIVHITRFIRCAIGENRLPGCARLEVLVRCCGENLQNGVRKDILGYQQKRVVRVK
jgi:hypothetical protein